MGLYHHHNNVLLPLLLLLLPSLSLCIPFVQDVAAARRVFNLVDPETCRCKTAPDCQVLVLIWQKRLTLEKSYKNFYFDKKYIESISVV